MLRRPPKSTRNDTRVPYPTPFRSAARHAPRPGGRPPRRLGARRAPGARRLRRPRTAGPRVGHRGDGPQAAGHRGRRSEEHTSELQSLMRISYAVFCLKKKKRRHTTALERTVEVTENTKSTQE